MRTFVLFLMVASQSSSALAQSAPHFDPSATRPAVAAAAASALPVTRRPAPGGRVVTGAVIGATAGAVTGWLLWEMTRDCGQCAPGPGGAVVGTALFGAGIGALIGGAPNRPDRRSGIPLGRRVAVDPAVSRSGAAGVMKIAF